MCPEGIVVNRVSYRTNFLTQIPPNHFVQSAFIERLDFLKEWLEARKTDILGGEMTLVKKPKNREAVGKSLFSINAFSDCPSWTLNLKSPNTFLGKFANNSTVYVLSKVYQSIIYSLLSAVEARWIVSVQIGWIQHREKKKSLPCEEFDHLV